MNHRFRWSLDSEHEQRVAPFELFFDLTFVFGFTQVTTLLTENPSASGLAQALFVMAALWWAWAAYAWLTNIANSNDGWIWGTMLIAMSAIFVAGLAVPTAFNTHGVVFGISFFVVILTQLLLYVVSTHDDPHQLSAIVRVAPSALGGAALILIAGFTDSGLKPAVWLAALIVGFVGPPVAGLRGIRVHPAHFIERHGLIIIVAIGESFVAVGFSAHSLPLDAGVILASVLTLVVAASFWLAYFDFFPARARHLLGGHTGAARTALARDAYTYLHLPMVSGIVLFAFGSKVALTHLDDDLASVPAVALCCGPALYLAAFVTLRLRVERKVGSGRLLAALVSSALTLVAISVPALVALALVASVWVALHAYELVWWRASRARIRASTEAPPTPVG